MSEQQLLALLQLAGGTFPTGGFSQSWGLETYVEEKRLPGEEALREFIHGYLSQVIVEMEGPALVQAYALAAAEDADGLGQLEGVLGAMKLTRETREASWRTGKALLRLGSQLTEDAFLHDYYAGASATPAPRHFSYPLAFGLLAARLGIPGEAALEAYIFASVNGLVQSAIKLIPLGVSQAQGLLWQLQGAMAIAARQTRAAASEELASFFPALDIASMRHEVLPTRLYMS